MLTEKRLAWESETISSERETGDFAASAAVSTVSVTEDVFQPFLTKVREGRLGFCFHLLQTCMYSHRFPPSTSLIKDIQECVSLELHGASK